MVQRVINGIHLLSLDHWRRLIGLRIKAQVAMVMHLDKCIGCHTCSVTCKNTWTNRPGTEYMWFNNVETRPGVGYPKRWEDTSRYKGGWILEDGKLKLRAGGPISKLVHLYQLLILRNILLLLFLQKFYRCSLQTFNLLSIKSSYISEY